MYSKNDYRYYLEHQLLVSDDYLAHYGVLGMKWGVRHDEQRRSSLMSKREKNNTKIVKYQNKLNTVGAQKREARAAKYQHKVDRLQRKASKAQKRLAQGKKVSNRQMKKLVKYETYKAKVAKNSVKNDKYKMKISDLQAKNSKIDKKIGKTYQRELNGINKEMRKDTNTKSYQNDLKKKSRQTILDAQQNGYDVIAKDRRNPKRGTKYKVKKRG